MSQCLVSWFRVYLSIILEMNGKLLTCLKFSLTVPLLSALISGHTTADFHLSQNSPVTKERLTIFAIDGRQCLSTFFSNVVLKMSSSHDFDGIAIMVL